MTFVEPLDVACRGLLARKPELGDEGWTFWEEKNLNLHRAVGLWRPEFQAPSPTEVGTQVRAAIARRFRVGWWRGFAFGVVIDVGTLPLRLETLASLIDGRANRKGTWQWTIVVSEKERTGFAVHMWMEGYLSPVFRDFCFALERKGYRLSRIRCEKDRTMRLLTAVADFHHAVHTLGLSREAFPEFDVEKR